MKITVPHMGNLNIALTALFRRLGIDYVSPPPITSRTYEIGFGLSPEQVCLPFKICMGNYIEAIELGADTIIMAGGNGPCRFGFYGVLQERILREAGYGARMIVLNQDNLPEVFSELATLTGRRTRLSLLPAFHFAWKILRLSEKNDELARRMRARAVTRRQADAAHGRFAKELLAVDTYCGVKAIAREMDEAYDSIAHNAERDGDDDTLRIGLLGEIYLVLDEKANMSVERRLGNLGAEVGRTLVISDWLLKLMHLDAFAWRSQRAMRRIAKPYMKSDVGGKGIQTIASAIEFARDGYDGLVHITPFSCMPETVATTILPKVCADHGIPCLYLTFDEHTSEAAVVTRLEAFTDMLRMRRAEKIPGRGRSTNAA